MMLHTAEVEAFWQQLVDTCRQTVAGWTLQASTNLALSWVVNKQ